MSSFSHYRVKNDLQTPILENSEDAKYDKYLETLRKNLKLKILSIRDDEMIFDLIGVDVSIANALRRILLAEVPTVAIETVFITENTSIIQDEVLSHRLGLIPIRCDPSKLDDVVGEEETDSDTVVFQLDAVCPQSLEPDKTEMVYSSHLKWIPQGMQEDIFKDGVDCVHSDIVIAKLKPGQRIALEAHARKGIGKDHTKFSPVATASYRLLPDISFREPILGNRAQQLVDLCPTKVFDIEDIRGVPTATVARPRDCTMCRECIRGEEWTDSVLLKRKADHFIFSIESVGSVPVQDIVSKAIQVLKSKAIKFQELVEEYEDTHIS